MIRDANRLHSCLISRCSVSTEAIAYMITYGFSAAVRYRMFCPVQTPSSCFLVLGVLVYNHGAGGLCCVTFCSTRVSNEIGAGNIDRAKNAVAVTMKLSVFLALSFILLLGF